MHVKVYVRGSFPSVRDVDDVVQESYLRIWRARAAQPIRSAKAFLFRVARNICLDAVKNSARSPIAAVGNLDAMPVYDQADGVLENVNAEEKLQILTDALATLPRRCREVFMLCKFQDHSRAQAAAKLGLSIRTVDAQMQNAYRRLEIELRKRGLNGASK